LNGWLKASGYNKGATVAPQTLYELGADWYAARLDVDWQPVSALAATALFARHGLTGAFWSLV
jgi:hypothetical protein